MTKKYKLLMCFLSYRIPLKITTARHYLDDSIYPECPRCKNAIEYDYQRFCGYCGQRLKWSRYNTDIIILPYYPEDHEPNNSYPFGQ